MKRVVSSSAPASSPTHDGELREDALARVCDVAAELHGAGGEAIIVTSGAIARGMRTMGLPQRPSTIGELQAASAVGQGKLYRVYDELLRERGVTSAQVLLTFFDMSARTHYLNARQTLATLLAWRVLPVINENDTTATDEISFGDNDFLAAQVAVLIGAEELILLTDIDGLFTADPRLRSDARLIERGQRFRGAARSWRSATRPRRWARAGCARRWSPPTWPRQLGSRRRSATASARMRCSTVLAGGPRRHAVRPARGPLQLVQAVAEVRQAGSGHARGRSLARRARCARAAPACCRSGSSAVQGEFDAGDAVEIAVRADGNADGTPGEVIGKGICNYSASELRQVMGMQSAAVRDLLPRATDEAVHRDYLVLD